MMEQIKSYTITVIAAVLLCAVVRALFGEKNRCIRLVSGLLVLLTVLAPIARINIDDVARAISRLELQKNSTITKPLQQNTKLMAQLIKEKCESYILDKADTVGAVPLEVCVTVKAGDPPIPIHAVISGQFTQRQKNLLAVQIESDLAIPQTEQEWKWKSTEE